MVNVAVVQMCASGSKNENLAKIRDMVGEAAGGPQAPDVVCLPEYCYGLPTRSNAQELGEGTSGEFARAMSALAEEHGVNILAGSFAETADDGRIHNTSLFFDRGGEVIGEYRKAHLMDAMSFKESDLVSPGDSLAVFDTDFGRVGLIVCYDLRFPEMIRTLALEGAEIILVPSAFPAGAPLPPRTDHWDVLTQSAALLNMVYVVAPNQFGHAEGENLFGRSCVIDPWGTRIAQASGREEVVHGRLDLGYVSSVRDSLAVYDNRREDLYTGQSRVLKS